MAVTITASLLATAVPQPVQIVLNGITTGLAYTVTGSAVGTTWTPPGGSGTSTGAQIVLSDSRTPLNVPITYSVVVSGATTTASAVTVTYTDRYVLQSLDGLTVLAFDWLDNDLPRSSGVYAATFDVPGRTRPVVRYAVGGDGGGAIEVRTTKVNTAVLNQILRAGRPVVLRTDGTLRDLAAVEIMLITAASSKARRALVAPATLSTDRDWSLGFTLVDDPQPSTAIGAFTWDYWDAKFAAKTWTNHDSLFSALTWDAWDAYDWSTVV